jgi:hypothetical protein
MSRLSRRAAIREFYRQQQNKPTEETQRRARAEQERERRLIKASEAFVDLGTVVIERDQVH